MAGIAALLRIRLPSFSLKIPESFQITSSYPLPSPSSLVGALAYSIAVHNGLSNESALKYTRAIVLAARASIPKAQIYTINPILLWRFRVLDRGTERPKRKQERLTLLQQLSELTSKESYLEGKLLLEQRLKDALYREYIFAQELNVVYLLKREIDEEVFHLISRLGDTESLCSVDSVKIYDYEILPADDVITRYPFTRNENILRIEGKFTVMKQCDENREMRFFIIPITRKIAQTRRGMKFMTLHTSEVKVTFKEHVNVAKIDDMYVII